MSDPHTLPAELTIYTVGELKGQCLAWMSEALPESEDSSEHWPLDAIAVDQVDAAGVQLLVSLSNSLFHQEQALQLLNVSPPLIEACAALGLADWLATSTQEGSPA